MPIQQQKKLGFWLFIPGLLWIGMDLRHGDEGLLCGNEGSWCGNEVLV